MNRELPKDKIRVGIVGCGIIADTHVEAILAARPDVEIAVVDPLPGKADLLRRKYQLSASYLDIAEMLSAFHPQVVHILTPPHWHISHARMCIEAGCHVLVEKPLCFNVTEAEQLYALAGKHGVSICVDHSLLFQPSVLQLRDALRDRGSPKILQLDSFYGMDADDGDDSAGPAGHWKQGIPGGALMDSLVHPISLAVGLTGASGEIAVSRIVHPQTEQLKVMWKTDDAIITLSVSHGAQPFRRTTQIITSGMTGIVDHSTEVFITMDQGVGPRSIKKVANNLSLGWQYIRGTFGTVWNVVRKKLQQNPGARALITAFYDHLAGRADNPTPEAAVLATTAALEQAARVIDPDSLSTKGHRPAPPFDDPAPPITRKVLVTGASGFLGRALCPQLLATGQYHVIGQVRRGANADKLPGARNFTRQYSDFDYFTPADFAAALKGVDDVVHCLHAAGAKTWADYKRRNVDHSLALYDAAAAAGVKRFIHVSSLAVYGMERSGFEPIRENARLSYGNSRWDYYVRSKTEAEHRLTARAVQGGPRLLILRLGLLYSAKGERLFAKSFPTRDGRLFIMIGNGLNHMPYTRVDKVAEQIVRTLDLTTFPEGAYNLVGDQSEVWKDFVTLRCEALGQRCRFIYLPSLPMRLAGVILETMHTLTARGYPPKITRYIVDSATRDLTYNTTKAEIELGWKPLDATSTT